MACGHAQLSAAGAAGNLNLMPNVCKTCFGFASIFSQETGILQGTGSAAGAGHGQYVQRCGCTPGIRCYFESEGGGRRGEPGMWPPSPRPLPPKKCLRARRDAHAFDVDAHAFDAHTPLRTSLRMRMLCTCALARALARRAPGEGGCQTKPGRTRGAGLHVRAARAEEPLRAKSKHMMASAAHAHAQTIDGELRVRIHATI